MSETLTKGRPWAFTIVRAYGFQRLRTEKSWRPIVTITVDDHKCHELSLGCDGQNPNLKECFQFDDIDASSQIDICVYHLAQSKKKNKRRNLVANARCTLQELARLQAQRECKQRSVEIKLNCVSRPKGGVNKARSSPVTLVAKFNFPEVCKAQPIYLVDIPQHMVHMCLRHSNSGNVNDIEIRLQAIGIYQIGNAVRAVPLFYSPTVSEVHDGSERGTSPRQSGILIPRTVRPSAVQLQSLGRKAWCWSETDYYWQY